MGYLKDNGKFMTYQESKPWQEYIKTHGVIQFINLFNKHKHITKPFDKLRWGHQSEYHVLESDPLHKTIQPYSNTLEEIEKYAEHPTDEDVTIMIEFGASMLETVPTHPFQSLEGTEILKVQTALDKEVAAIQHLLKEKNLTLVTTSVVPYFGAEFDRSRPLDAKENFFTEQAYSSDANISHHSRFVGMAQNIRLRRGKNVFMGEKVWMDKYTDPSKFPKDNEGDPFIHMDSQLYGMSGSSLQLTYEANCMNHARYLHDMLLSLTPVYLALSANTGILRGVLSQTDSRFSVIRGSVDCRTDEELEPDSPLYKVKPRYSGINHYISQHEYIDKSHTDTPQLEANPQHLSLLKEAGVDEVLASHIAQLFVYDAVVAFPDKIEVDDTEYTNHFESLQSTNWHTLRFKPPPSMDSPIGWRVEFRSMDLQLTAYENAALSVVISMMVNVINFYNVDLILPITKVDENIEAGQALNAAVTGLYWTKLHKQKTIRPNILLESQFLKSDAVPQQAPFVYRKISIAQILAGYTDENGYSFPGYHPLISKYMQDRQYKQSVIDKIEEYMDFILQRARGLNCTGAQWIRKFVASHPSYKGDSFVSEDILFDMYHSEGIKEAWRGSTSEEQFKEQNMWQEKKGNAQDEEALVGSLVIQKGSPKAEEQLKCGEQGSEEILK